MKQSGEINSPVALLGMGTAVPHLLPQTVAADMAVDLCCASDGEKAWLRRVYDRAGVQARGSVLRVGDAADDGADMRAFYPSRKHVDDRGPSTAVRMQRFAVEAPPLAARAAAAALADAEISADAITHLITVSCTGFFAPGLDIELIERLRLPATIRRTHVGFMGCHAAINALTAAQSIAAADASARVMVCCVELCTLHFAYGWRPEKMIANSLFGDGAAAVIVSDPGNQIHPPRWLLHRTSSVLLRESGSLMGWTIGDHGFEMTLSADVPSRVRGSIRDWVADWGGGELQHWAIHPGGPKVITAVGEAMELDDEQLLPSRAMLERLGNMSSTTVLFILDRLARDGARGRCAAVAFGPGLTMEGMLLSR